MRNLLSIPLTIIAGSASAGGLGQIIEESPRPIARPVLSWAGAYAGVSAGSQRVEQSSTSTEEIRENCEPLAETGHWIHKCVAPSQYTADLPRGHWRYCTDDPYCVIGKAEGGDLIWLNEPFSYVTDTITTITESEDRTGAFGAFAGTRRDIGGGWLIGAEVNVTHSDALTLGTVEGTLSYDMGALLPHIDAGFAHDGDEGAFTYSAGVDMRIGRYGFAGLEYMAVPDLRVDAVAIRAGVQW